MISPLQLVINSCKWSFKTISFQYLSDQSLLSNYFLHGNSGAPSDHHANHVPVLPTDPPTITESKSNEATTGRQASLKCEASAVPAPDFEWYRDDTRYVCAKLAVPDCSDWWS